MRRSIIGRSFNAVLYSSLFSYFLQQFHQKISSFIQFPFSTRTRFSHFTRLKPRTIPEVKKSRREIMGKQKSFKDEFTLEQRSNEAADMLAKYPDRVPVIAEKYSRTDLPALEKKKFLVPRDMSVGHFIHILSGRLRLASGKALFVFVKDTLPQTSCLLDSVYETYKDEDGFLYMCYSSEKTFGSAVTMM